MGKTGKRSRDQIAFAVLMFVCALLNFKEIEKDLDLLFYSSFDYFTLYAPAVLFEVSFIVLGIVLLVRTRFGTKKYAALVSVCFVIFGICRAVMYIRHYYIEYFLLGVSYAFLAVAGLVLLCRKPKKRALIALLCASVLFCAGAVAYKTFCLVKTCHSHDYSQYEGRDFLGYYYDNIVVYRSDGIFDIVGIAAFLLALILIIVFLCISYRHKKDASFFKKVFVIPGIVYFLISVVSLAGRSGGYNGDVTSCFFTAALLLFGYWLYRDYRAGSKTCPKACSETRAETRTGEQTVEIDTKEQLQAIQKLFVSGVITEAEYEAKLRQILGQK